MHRRLIFGLAAAACFGQEFEVVSIRPNNSMPGNSSSHSDKERLTAINVSLRNLIVRAYDVKDYQIEGPDWLKSEHFEVAEKFPEPLPEDPDKYDAAMQSMMQKMLADRVQFAAHRDQKTLAVYALAVGKSGIRFQSVPKGASSSRPCPPEPTNYPRSNPDSSIMQLAARSSSAQTSTSRMRRSACRRKA